MNEGIGLLKFGFEKVDPAGFVSFWSKLYDPGRYPDEEYLKHLKVNEDLMISEELTGEDIEPLFVWKNGMSLSKNKKKIVEKAKEKLKEINKFRKSSQISEDDINKFFELVSKISDGIIYRTFILHIAKPDEFPIFDRYVFRACNFINKRQTSNEPKDFGDYKYYRNFFRQLKLGSNKDWRETDKALMAFGQFLESQFYKNNPD